MQVDYFRVRHDLCAIAKATRRTTSTIRLPIRQHDCFLLDSCEWHLASRP